MESSNVSTEYITLTYHEQVSRPGHKLLTVVKGRVSGYAGERSFYFTAPECQPLINAKYTFTGLDGINIIMLTDVKA